MKKRAYLIKVKNNGQMQELFVVKILNNNRKTMEKIEVAIKNKFTDLLFVKLANTTILPFENKPTTPHEPCAIFNYKFLLENGETEDVELFAHVLDLH